MSLEIYGLILLVGLFFFICVGFPISFTLITLGAIFGYIGLGPKVFHLMTFSFWPSTPRLSSPRTRNPAR